MSFEKALADAISDQVAAKVVAALEDQFAALLGAQPGSEDLLTVTQAAARLGVKPATLRQWLNMGKGPKPLKLGTSAQSAVRFHPRVIARFIQERQK